MIFLFELRDINSQACKKITPLSHMYHTYAKLLELLQSKLHKSHPGPNLSAS